MGDDALEFFNDLSGRLEVELTEAPAQLGSLSNLVAPPTTRLKGVSVRWRVSADDFRELRPEEWDAVAMPGTTTLRLASRVARLVVVEHHAPDGQGFTVRDLAAAVERTEAEVRGTSRWLDGIDVHHVYFEGLKQREDGVWEIGWGS